MKKILETFKKRIGSSPLFTEPRFEKYRMLLVPVVVLVLATAVIILITVPQIIKLFNTYKTIEELGQKRIFYQKKALELESMKIEDFRKDLDTALVALPVDKDIPGVMGEILVALGGSGMGLDGITFSSAPPESDKVAEYAITITATGTEASLLNFFERVSLTPRLIRLATVKIDTGTNGSLNAGLTFATFYQLLPTNIGSIDEDVPKIDTKDTQLLTDIEAKLRQFPKVSSQQAASRTTTGKVDPFRP